MSYQALITKVLKNLKATPEGKQNYFVSRYQLKKYLDLEGKKWIHLNKALKNGVKNGIFLKKGDSFRLNSRISKKRKKKLQNFTFIEYKNCLLVKTPKGILNNQKVGPIYNIPTFSRPMYWNKTLSGWIASPKDRTELINLGIKYN